MCSRLVISEKKKSRVSIDDAQIFFVFFLVFTVFSFSFDEAHDASLYVGEGFESGS